MSGMLNGGMSPFCPVRAGDGCSEQLRLVLKGQIKPHNPCMSVPELFVELSQGRSLVYTYRLSTVLPPHATQLNPLHDQYKVYRLFFLSLGNAAFLLETRSQIIKGLHARV